MLLQRIARRLCGFIADEHGAAIVEYGVALGLIVVVTAATVIQFGGEVETLFRDSLAVLNITPD